MQTSPQDSARPPVVIVTGPTAGGKSGLALELAEAFDGVVINADSMQVYRELEILTARPGPRPWRGRRTGSMAPSPATSATRPGAGARWRWRRSPPPTPPASCRWWSAAPGFICAR